MGQVYVWCAQVMLGHCGLSVEVQRSEFFPEHV